jgi:hypothetical protein
MPLGDRWGVTHWSVVRVHQLIERAEGGRTFLFFHCMRQLARLGPDENIGGKDYLALSCEPEALARASGKLIKKLQFLNQSRFTRMMLTPTQLALDSLCRT